MRLFMLSFPSIRHPRESGGPAWVPAFGAVIQLASAIRAFGKWHFWRRCARLLVASSPTDRIRGLILTVVLGPEAVRPPALNWITFPQARIQGQRCARLPWVPACAGMTTLGSV